MEKGLVADVALVHAWKGDTEGNLVYRKTARNFNPAMATAGKATVAEGEHPGAAGAHARWPATGSRPAGAPPTISTRRGFSCGASCTIPTTRSASSSAPCASA